MNTPFSFSRALTLSISLILVSSLGVSLISPVSATVPTFPPPGGVAGGLFSQNFLNMSSGGCTGNSVIIGFDPSIGPSYLTPICLDITGIVGSIIAGTNIDALIRVYLGTNVGVVAGKVLSGFDAAGNALYVPSGGAGGTICPGTGFDNTCYGSGALYSNTSGGRNTANGMNALFSNTIGYHNTANGSTALYSNTIGLGNTANGFSALYSNFGGSQNTANGFAALYQNTSGSNNIASGFAALFSNTMGYHNTANGSTALYSNTTGFSNTANGYSAGSNITTGSSNIAIGYNSQVASPTASDQLSIGNWIYGTSGNIGIGTSAPTAKLEVAGNIIANNPILPNHVATKAYVDAAILSGAVASSCTPNADFACYEGNSYWQDSCGNRGSRRLTCQNGCWKDKGLCLTFVDTYFDSSINDTRAMAGSMDRSGLYCLQLNENKIAFRGISTVTLYEKYSIANTDYAPTIDPAEGDPIYQNPVAWCSIMTTPIYPGTNALNRYYNPSDKDRFPEFSSAHLFETLLGYGFGVNNQDNIYIDYK